MAIPILLVIVGGVLLAAGITISTKSPMGQVLIVPGGLLCGAGLYWMVGPR